MYVITRGARDLRELGRGAWVGVGDLQPAAVLFPGHPGCSPSALKLLHLAKKCYFGARLEEWADHMGGWVLGWLCCVARGSVVLMLIYIYIVYIYIFIFFLQGLDSRSPTLQSPRSRFEPHGPPSS